MNLVFPAQERPARNALTVGVRCVKRTRKHAASVTAYFVLPADVPFSAALEASFSRPQGTPGAKKGLEFAYAEIAFGSGCLFNFISFICSSVIGTVSGDRDDSPL